MSRYTTCDHGMTVAFGNMFICWDQYGELHDFPSMLVFEKMYPKQISSVNCRLDSFAHQMVWERKRFPIPNLDLYTTYARHNVVRPWWTNWLNKNTPGWMIPPFNPDFTNESATIFFEKVSHSRLMRDTIHQHLEGMPPVKSSTLHGKKKK